MSEFSFCKSFLSTLDSRPVKLPADYVFDPQTVGLRVPVSSAVRPGLVTCDINGGFRYDDSRCKRQKML